GRPRSPRGNARAPLPGPATPGGARVHAWQDARLRPVARRHAEDVPEGSVVIDVHDPASPGIDVEFDFPTLAVDRVDFVFTVVVIDLLDAGIASRRELLVDLADTQPVVGGNRATAVVVGHGGRYDRDGAGDTGGKGNGGKEAGCTHDDDSFRVGCGPCQDRASILAGAC